MAVALGERAITADLFVYDKGSSVGKIPIEYPFRLDHYSIILVTAGHCAFQINLRTELKTKDDLLIIAPQSWNQIMSISEDFQAQMVSFTVDFHLKAGLNRRHIDSFEFFLNEQSKKISLRPEAAILISRGIVLVKEKCTAEPTPYKRDLIVHAFCLLMFEMMTAVKFELNLTKDQLSRQETYALRFVKLLTQHIRTARNLAFYADQLGISSDYLSKITKLIFHHPASVLIDETVIQESKILLYSSTLSIAQIADQMSFANQFHFSKFFKKKTSYTPSAFRKMQVHWKRDE